MTTMTRTKAFISSIGRHRFELDGHGVRSLVVFDGCPLRCKYCINPYTWNGAHNPTEYTTDMLLQKVAVDSVYFQATKGGITFGGGEPLLHARFISDFIDIAPDSWNYIVETSLSVPFENIAALADKIETFVVDIKSMDANIYRNYTGAESEVALNNLVSLIKLVGADRIIVRVPVIPGYADEKSQALSVKKLNNLGITQIDSFNYRTK